jgi:hypothetical protein
MPASGCDRAVHYSSRALLGLLALGLVLACSLLARALLLLCFGLGLSFGSTRSVCATPARVRAQQK